MKPMLASPMKKGNITNWSDWAVEEKYDGHRMLVHVEGGARVTPTQVHAYARPRGDGRMIERDLPAHLVASFAMLPDGIYDGELMGGDTSTDVSRLDLKHTLRFVVFDVLVLHGGSTCTQTWTDRHLALHRIFLARTLTGLSLATPRLVTSEKDVTEFVTRVWNEGGEGAILKRRASTYQVGKRSKDWIKIKRQEIAALTVVGFEPTRGTVMNRGPFAIVKLRDDDGNETTCKTLNDHELARIQKADTLDYATTLRHPWIGRKLVIEFQQRTRTGGYRGPVLWDRWEDE